LDFPKVILETPNSQNVQLGFSSDDLGVVNACDLQTDLGEWDRFETDLRQTMSYDAHHISTKERKTNETNAFISMDRVLAICNTDLTNISLEGITLAHLLLLLLACSMIYVIPYPTNVITPLAVVIALYMWTLNDVDQGRPVGAQQESFGSKFCNLARDIYEEANVQSFSAFEASFDHTKSTRLARLINVANEISKEQAKGLIHGIKSERPFVEVCFFETFRVQALADTGSSLNLVSLEVAERLMQEIGQQLPIVQINIALLGVGSKIAYSGAVVLHVTIAGFELGYQPFIIASTISPSVGVILGTGLLSKANMVLSYSHSGKADLTFRKDTSPEPFPIKVEMLATDEHSLALVNQSIIMPKSSAKVELVNSSMPGIDSFGPRENPISVVPHPEWDQILEFSGIGSSTGTGSIVTTVTNNSSEPKFLEKGTDIGVCSVFLPQGALAVSPIGSSLLSTCPCNLKNKIVVVDNDGSTGLGEKHELLSPFSTQPLKTGLYMKDGTVYVVAHKAFGFAKISEKLVQDFFDRNVVKFSRDERYNVLLENVNMLTFSLQKVLAYMAIHILIDLKILDKEKSDGCKECKDGSLSSKITTDESYRVRNLNVVFLITSNRLPAEHCQVVEGEDIIGVEIAGCRMFLVKTGYKSMSFFVHILSVHTNQSARLHFILHLMLRQLKVLFPKASVSFACNAGHDCFKYQLLEQQLKDVLDHVIPHVHNWYDATKTSNPREQKEPNMECLDLRCSRCACDFCHVDSKGKMGYSVILTQKNWPALGLDDIAKRLVRSKNWGSSEDPTSISAEHAGPVRSVAFADQAEKGKEKNEGQTFSVPRWGYVRLQGEQDLHQKVVNDAANASPQTLGEALIDESDPVHYDGSGPLFKKHVPPAEYFDHYSLEGYKDDEIRYVKLLFNEFATELFAFDKGDTSRVRDEEVHLDLVPGCKLPVQKAIPMQKNLLHKGMEIVADMQRKGICRPATRATAVSAAIITYKDSEAKSLHKQGKDYRTRLVINFIELNKCLAVPETLSGNTYISGVLENIATLSRSRYKSLVDCLSAFLSLKLDLESQNLCSFALQGIPVQSQNCLPLGLQSSPGYWSTVLFRTLDAGPKIAFEPLPGPDRPLKGQELVEGKDFGFRLGHTCVHVDDLSIAFRPDEAITEAFRGWYRKNGEEPDEAHGFIVPRELELHIHYLILRSIFEVLRAKGVLISVPKMRLFRTDAVVILGFKVLGNTVSITEDKRQALTERVKTPRNKRELASLLGAMNFISSHIFGYQILAGCLYQLLGKEAEFKLTEKHLQAIDLLKQAVSDAPSTMIFNASYPLYICSDASREGYSSVIFQEIQGARYLIKFQSGRFTPQQLKAAPSCFQELAGLLYTVLSSSYLCVCASELILECDCQTLIAALMASELRPNSVLSRVCHKLLSLGLKFKPVWKKHTNPQVAFCDFLSRQVLFDENFDSAEYQRKVQELAGRIGIPDDWAKEGRIVTTPEILDHYYGHFSPESFKMRSPVVSEEILLEISAAEYLQGIDEIATLEEQFAEQVLTTMVMGASTVVSHTTDILALSQYQPSEGALVAELASVGAEVVTDEQLIPEHSTALIECLQAELNSEDSFLGNLQHLSLDEIAKAQRNDSVYGPMIQRLLKLKHDPQNSRFKLQGNNQILVRLSRGDDNIADPLNGYRIVLPPYAALVTMVNLHMLSHAGQHRLMGMFRKTYFSRFAEALAKNVASCCKTCKVYNLASRDIYLPGHIPAARQKHDIWIADIMFLRSNSKENALLTTIDRHTGFCAAAPLKSLSGRSVVDAFESIIVQMGSICDTLLTDRGSNLLSPIVAEFFKSRGCRRTTSLAYNPTGHSPIETMNAIIRKTLLKLSFILKEDNRVKLLPLAINAINQTPRKRKGFDPKTGKETTHYVSPSFLLRGHGESPSAREIYRSFGLPDERLARVHEELNKLIRSYNFKLHEDLKKEAEVSRRTPEMTFQKGDLVLLQNMPPSKHTQTYKSEVYVILELSHRRAIVQSLSNHKEGVRYVTVRQLKHYKSHSIFQQLPAVLKNRFHDHQPEDDIRAGKAVKDYVPTATRPINRVTRSAGKRNKQPEGEKTYQDESDSDDDDVVMYGAPRPHALQPANIPLAPQVGPQVVPQPAPVPQAQQPPAAHLPPPIVPQQVGPVLPPIQVPQQVGPVLHPAPPQPVAPGVAQPQAVGPVPQPQQAVTPQAGAAPGQRTPGSEVPSLIAGSPLFPGQVGTPESIFIPDNRATSSPYGLRERVKPASPQVQQQIQDAMARGDFLPRNSPQRMPTRAETPDLEWDSSHDNKFLSSSATKRFKQRLERATELAKQALRKKSASPPERSTGTSSSKGNVPDPDGAGAPKPPNPFARSARTRRSPPPSATGPRDQERQAFTRSTRTKRSPQRAGSVPRVQVPVPQAAIKDTGTKPKETGTKPKAIRGGRKSVPATSSTATGQHGTASKPSYPTTMAGIPLGRTLKRTPPPAQKSQSGRQVNPPKRFGFE